MSDNELQAILARAQANRQARTKNTNIDADANPLHHLADNTITKSHALSRAYYRLSLTEKRCMEALISKLHPLRTDNQLQHIELLATEYLKAFPDAGKHAYEHLSGAGDALVNRVITIENPSEGIAKDKLTLMARVRYQPKQGKIICTFNPLVVPHLIGLREKFSSYPLKKAVDFQSSYTWRFYEILASWAQPKKDTKGSIMGWIKNQSVDELREMLGVPDSYSWGKFDTQVLQVAINELRNKSKIAVFIERIKTNRKITHLNISFIEDNQVEMPLEGGETPKKKRGRKPQEA
ncbi:replication initiation protein [uncultured Thiothrix sp.]|jgi:plasmid replication initiation protein|uniref:replication initiation protein n=1 Tax=uncultured Thiothrix sp. TaxID=223185 RepID=UPI00262D8AA9|nr:replication initiation protein [uncultured Thiothrix sp.]HRJ94983.1 replication initiation protein [Candidatus Thiothrix moscowensis]